MSSPEQVNPSPKPEFKLILPSLPVPTPGIFEDVYSDYLDDPDRFFVAVAFKMGEDTNPGAECFISQDNPMHRADVVSAKWPAIYYEIFSRSARNIGLPLPHLKDEASTAYFSTELLKNEYALEDIDSRGEQRIEAEKKDLEKRIKRDKVISPELVKFWNMVDQDAEGRKLDGDTESDILFYLMSLRTLQAIMQRQDDEYALAEQYLLSQ